jgi:hypothetical protein
MGNRPQVGFWVVFSCEEVSQSEEYRARARDSAGEDGRMWLNKTR